jgi:hypothetical protein
MSRALVMLAQRGVDAEAAARKSLNATYRRFMSEGDPVRKNEAVAERQISQRDLRRLQDWVNTGPWAPDGDWYKDFGSFTICGSGEFPKTVLTQGMALFGSAIE